MRAGEIVGIAGVSGNGQKELLAALSGEDTARRRRLRSRLFGQDIGTPRPRRRRALGLHFVPEERLGPRRGADARRWRENTLLTRNEPVGRRGWLDTRRACRRSSRSA